jgi:hypothetical protein
LFVGLATGFYGVEGMSELQRVSTEPRTAKIVELFERNRATPGAPYDEQHFLDFLLPAPRRPRAVYNSFRGLRRFNAFIDEVQLEFAICFSLKDRDANYPLPRFVDRVIELERSRRGSLVSLKNQARAGAGWQVLIFANVVLLIIGVWLRTETWAIATLLVLALALNAAFVRFAQKRRAYLAQLQNRIESRGIEKLDDGSNV